jgi:hypothetical protein
MGSPVYLFLPVARLRTKLYFTFTMEERKMPRRKQTGHKANESKSKPYVWVKDDHGEEYLCPGDAVKEPEDAKEAELESCIDVEPLRKYLDE